MTACGASAAPPCPHRDNSGKPARAGLPPWPARARQRPADERQPLSQRFTSARCCQPKRQAASYSLGRVVPASSGRRCRLCRGAEDGSRLPRHGLDRHLPARQVRGASLIPVEDLLLAFASAVEQRLGTSTPAAGATGDVCFELLRALPTPPDVASPDQGAWELHRDREIGS